MRHPTRSRFHTRRPRRPRAFSVLEVAAAVFILSAVSSVALISYTNASDRSVNVAVQAAHTSLLRDTLSRYRLAGGALTWEQALAGAVNETRGDRTWQLLAPAAELSADDQMSYVTYVDTAADPSSSQPVAGITIASLGHGNQTCFAVTAIDRAPSAWCAPADHGISAAAARVNTAHAP